LYNIQLNITLTLIKRMSKFKEVYLSQMKTCYKSVFISRVYNNFTSQHFI